MAVDECLLFVYSCLTFPMIIPGSLSPRSRCSTSTEKMRQVDRMLTTSCAIVLHRPAAFNERIVSETAREKPSQRLLLWWKKCP